MKGEELSLKRFVNDVSFGGGYFTSTMFFIAFSIVSNYRYGITPDVVRFYPHYAEHACSHFFVRLGNAVFDLSEGSGSYSIELVNHVYICPGVKTSEFICAEDCFNEIQEFLEGIESLALFMDDADIDKYIRREEEDGYKKYKGYESPYRYMLLEQNNEPVQD